MNTYDIIYFKGNPSSGTEQQHYKINTSITELINKHNYLVLDSEHKNLSNITIPKAKIYIGFSRGSRYLKKLDSKALKISIGGVKSSGVYLFKNTHDNILLGDISPISLDAHFEILDIHKIKIKSLIDDFLNS